MIRFEITMKRPAMILDGHGMIECVIAPGSKGMDPKFATIIVYVCAANSPAFTQILKDNPLVAEFFSHSVAERNYV